MNLLFTRGQNQSSPVSLVPLRVGGTVTFTLKAELEFSDEEKALVRKYGFADAPLTNSDTSADLARAYKPSFFIGMIAALLTAVFYSSPYRGLDGILAEIGMTLAVGVVVILAFTAFYFFALREYISVGQLLNGGRTFFCRSVVELTEKEAYLRDISKRLHATVVQAKNWGGREINPIPEGSAHYAEPPKQKAAMPTTQPTMIKSKASTVHISSDDDKPPHISQDSQSPRPPTAPSPLHDMPTSIPVVSTVNPASTQPPIIQPPQQPHLRAQPTPTPPVQTSPTQTPTAQPHPQPPTQTPSQINPAQPASPHPLAPKPPHNGPEGGNT